MIIPNRSAVKIAFHYFKMPIFVVTIMVEVTFFGPTYPKNTSPISCSTQIKHSTDLQCDERLSKYHLIVSSPRIHTL